MGLNMMFMNVDLEMESAGALSLLAEEFGRVLTILHQGELEGLQHLLVEPDLGPDDDAEACVIYLCRLIEDLRPEARAEWDRCGIRLFDIGYSADGGVQIVRSMLRHETLQRVAGLGAGIMITLYPPHPYATDVEERRVPGCG
jgi:hypothetical protein